MEAKYIQALKAGIIGGVILGAIIVVNFIIAIIASSSKDLTVLGVLNCCIFIGLIIIMAGVGALSVRMASSVVKTLSDALVVSGVAGAIAGFICAVVYAVTQIISPWVTSGKAYESISGVGDVSQLGLSAYGLVGSICCCGPAFLFASVLLAVIGGAIYAVLVLKVS